MSSLLLQACVVVLLLSDARYSIVIPLAQSAELSVENNAGGSLCGEDLCRCSDNRQEAQCLELSGNITSLPRLPQSVRVLKLSFDESFRNLTNDIFFYNTSHITCLHLLQGQVNSLNKQSFLWTPNLTSLHVYPDFAFRPVTNGRNTPMDLIAPLFSIPSLHFVNVTNCGLSFAPKKTFRAVGKSQIETLYLTGNFVPEEIDLGGFVAFKQLKQLHLEDINIVFITSGRVRLPELKGLYLDNNGIGIFPETCRGNKSLYPKLEVLSLVYNVNVGNPFVLAGKVCLPRLQTLWLDFTPVVSIPADFFGGSNFPLLTKLYAKAISHALKIPRCAFCNKKLTFLMLASNGIDFAQAAQADVKAFADMPRLQTLVLDNNFLKMNDSLFQRLFGGLSSLTTLSLSNCQFNAFTKRTFAIFPSLSQLNLSNNRIRKIPDGIFEPIPNLRNLDLSANQLASVSEEVFSPQARQSLLKLNLSDNRFQCSCDMMWLSKWMVTNPDVFDYPNASYNCRNLPGKDIPEFSKQEHACLLRREINVLIIFGISLAIIALTVFSLVYRYRWHVRLLLYEVFRGRDNVRRRHLQADHFDYDVFVSYASEDLPWIRQHLMPNLEDNLGLRLCIHERDFIPGKNILENIADCVQSSKKILVVYSKDFVLSQWCQFELTFCLRHVMDYDDALVIVCVDDVVSRQMTSAMMAVLKATTYIQWAEEEDAVRSFWRRLRLALHEVTEQAEHV